MTPPSPVFHALLRPAVLQILRAAGYQGTKAAVLDSLTDLAVRYFYRLCELTAIYAAHNGTDDRAPSVVDVRLALQQVGALLPEKTELEQEYLDIEDVRGTEAFLAWIQGPVNREIKRIALDGNDEARDYLDGKLPSDTALEQAGHWRLRGVAIKQKHSKTDDDTKYVGTLLGKPVEHGDVMVEGGEYPSVLRWEENLKAAARRSPEIVEAEREASEAPSSGLSSLGDRTLDHDMDLLWVYWHSLRSSFGYSVFIAMRFGAGQGVEAISMIW